MPFFLCIVISKRRHLHGAIVRRAPALTHEAARVGRAFQSATLTTPGTQIVRCVIACIHRPCYDHYQQRENTTDVRTNEWTVGMSILTNFGKIERTYQLPFQSG